MDDSSDSEEESSPPEAERPSRKRRRSAEDETSEIKTFNQSVNISGTAEEVESISSESGKSGRSSSEEDEEESPSAKFRRGKKLVQNSVLVLFNFFTGEEISSEFEIDSNDSVDSVEQPGSEDDDREWNMMGAALEREFLGSND